MSCPGKLGREYGKPNWNNDKSRTRQHDQCNSNQQYTAADDEHDNSPDRLDGPKPRLVKESFCPVHTEAVDYLVTVSAANEAQRVSDREMESVSASFFGARSPR